MEKPLLTEQANQLALPLKLHDHAIFESFWPAGNETLVAFLQATARSGEGPGGWLWGAAATGKTHLLQAVCERSGDSAMYLPLRTFADTGPAVLDGLASRQFVCLDDVDAVAGNTAWELGLFDLYNQLADAGGVLLVSARAAQRACHFSLADLASRFSRLPTFQLHALEEVEVISALQLRARQRGLDLPTDSAKYLLTRLQRDMASLYQFLDKLDTAALRAQRRLTVPFIRQVLLD